jgi:hypothetical protein
MKTRQEILKERYGFDKGSYQYVPRGAEILKMIGQNVIKVEYDKKDDGTWDTNFEPVFLVSISDFDPLNMSYKCVYKRSPEEGEQEFRMIPEGYSWADSEDVTHIVRLLPGSMHCQLTEDELFYERMKQLWETRDTLDFTALAGLASSKDKDTTLRYSRHLACLIRLEGEENVLYFRIHKLSLKHKAGKQYALSLWDGEDNPVKALIESDQKEYDFELGTGTFKIIDLC